MSKIAKNIKMLDILSSGRKYTCRQLSQMLEVTPRMIRQYKDELEKEGIYIEASLGVNGGYRLKQELDMPSILFSDEDIYLLDELMKKNSKDVVKIKELQNKIIRLRRLINDKCELSNDEQDKLNDIKLAIDKSEKLKIQYYSKGILKEREVIPKQIYLYDDFIMIVVQYSEDKEDIRHINLKRIDKVIM